MKSLRFIWGFILLIILGQCFAGPISTRTGIKMGLTSSTYDRDDTGNVFKGTGVLLGMNMGTDFFRLIAIDMAWQYRTTRQARDETFGRSIYSYNNFFYPILLSLKGGMIPMVAPYISLGIGINNSSTPNRTEKNVDYHFAFSFQYAP